MRSPSLRVALVGIAAVAVLAGGSLATRHGPIGGSGEAEGGQAGTVTAAGSAGTATTTAPASLGTMSERLARPPAVAPRELQGVLDIGGTGCEQETLDLATLVRTRGRRDICAVPGAAFGIRLRDVRRNSSRLGVVDREGRPQGTIPVPDGWLYVYRDGERHAIDPSLAGRGGVVSPDGTRVVLQRDQRLLVVLDAATLRPLARIEPSAVASCSTGGPARAADARQPE